jgi:hypothetical protein
LHSLCPPSDATPNEYATGSEKLIRNPERRRIVRLGNTHLDFAG